MGRRKDPQSAKGPKSPFNPMNFAPPARAAIVKMRETANVSQAEAARAIGFERPKANITWYRFEAKTTAKQTATPTRFQYIALFNILMLDDDPRNWSAGLSGGIVPNSLPRLSGKSPLDLAKAVPSVFRMACANNPLNYVPPTPAQIRAARAKANLSLVDAANTIGVSKSAWQKFEYGFTFTAGRKIKKEIPFHDWALFNILALKDDAKNWRAGLPSPKTPYVHSGYRTIPMRDNRKAAVKYTVARYQLWRQKMKGGGAKAKRVAA